MDDPRRHLKPLRIAAVIYAAYFLAWSAAPESMPNVLWATAVFSIICLIQIWRIWKEAKRPH